MIFLVKVNQESSCQPMLNQWKIVFLVYILPYYPIGDLEEARGKPNIQ
jgi:hypothetical protein